MRKLVIVVLIFLGGCLGLWLAIQNQRMFELSISQEQLQNGNTSGQVAAETVKIGMDMWQVKEILGPPDERVLISGPPGAAEETWTYQNHRLLFESGVLKRMENN